MNKEKSLSVRKIANLTGLSPATVSRALNNSEHVSRDAKAKIMKVLEDNGAKGIMDKLSAPKLIGVVAASTRSEYYLSLLNHIMEYFDDRGDSVISYFPGEQKLGGMEAIKILSSLHVDGIIVISLLDMHYKKSEINNIPIICIDPNDRFDDNFCTVTSDHYNAGKLAADLFVSKGCKHPILITGQGDSERSLLRQQGFGDTLSANNISFTDEMVIHSPIMHDSFKEGREAVMYFYTKGIKFDSIFAVNDLRAIGAYTAVQELGLKVPEDIKIISNDGVSVTNNNIFHITSIQQNTALIARSACEMLEKEINHEQSSNPHVIVPVQIQNGVTL